MPRKDTGPFRVGERVLVPHTDKYYPAKTLKAEKRDDGLFYYLIHYNGWNKKWDEWVEAPGLVKFDPNLAKVDLTDGANGHGDGSEGPKGTGGPARRTEKKKRPDDLAAYNFVHGGGIHLSAMAMKLSVNLPPLLKRVLLDDWDGVAAGALVPLPRAPSVADILQQYVTSRRAIAGSAEAEEEVANGVRLYFDKALRHLLLYEQERDQCDKALTDGATPSAVYGGEHLLRLLVKLPELIPPATMLPAAYAALSTRLGDLAQFLQRHQAHFFLPPPAAYHSQALGAL